MSPDQIQALLQSGWAAMAVLLFTLGAPLLAWVLAGLAAGFGRAPMGIGVAATLSALGWVGLRIVALAEPSLRAGPLAWLDLLGTPTAGWLPIDALRAAALCHGLVFPILGLVGGFWVRRWPMPSAPFPAAGLVCAVAVGVAMLGLVAANGPFAVNLAAPPLPDLAGVVPTLLVALGLCALSPAEASPTRAAQSEEPETATDPVDAWRRMGALPAEATPLVQRPARAPADEGGFLSGLWGAAGGAGSPPAVLVSALRALSRGGKGLWLADLPESAERLLLNIVALVAARTGQTRLLVVTDSPGEALEVVRAAMARAGMTGMGHGVAGAEALSAALSQKRPPLVAFLDTAALCSGALQILGDPRSGGAAWVSTVGLVVVVGLDRGSPLAASHRHFALKRLGLVLRSAGAQWSAVATGLGLGRGLLEAAFPGLSVEDMPLGADAAQALTVWRVSPRWVGGAGGPWVKRALEGFVRAGSPVSVGDPEGAFERRSLADADAPLRLVRGLALSGVASASALDAAWLVAGWRALENRVQEAAAPSHAALWQVVDRPITRFLLRDSNLDGLSRAGKLPSPRPGVGMNNPVIARTHLQAALREGRPDRPALNALFGQSLVEQLAGDPSSDKAHALRGDPRGVLSRVALVAGLSGEPLPALHLTVGERVVAVVCGSERIAEVDAALAPTRFPPQRVFAVGERRYQVPLHSLDSRRDEIRVDPAAPDVALNTPVCSMTVSRAVAVEATQEIVLGIGAHRVRVLVGTADITVHEQVSGVRMPDGSSLQYAPVVAQYRGRMRTLLFPSAAVGPALFHLARSARDVLSAWLFAGEDDLEVIVLDPGLFAGSPAGLGVVDRSVQGLGVAEAIDPAAAGEILRWTRAVLATCRCAVGCPNCTPEEVLAAGPDKAGVLRILGG